MHFSTASISLILALTSSTFALRHNAHGHLHRRHYNQTNTPELPTDTGSASGVLDPTSATSVSVPLGTDPVSSSVLSSAVENLASSVLGTGPASQSLPLGTGPAAPFPTGNGPSLSGTAPTAPAAAISTGSSDAGQGSGDTVPTVSNQTLTYTLGSGESTSVVTTTIQVTSYSTRTHTVTASDGAASGAGNAASSAEPTTTTTSYSTTTTTVLVEEATGAPGSGAAAGAADSNNNAAAASGAEAGGSNCAAPATVTSTILSTITVTADPSTGAGADPTQASLPTLVGNNAPFPTGNNGTDAGIAAASGTGKKPCSSSGFLTKSRPSASGISPVLKRMG